MGDAPAILGGNPAFPDGLPLVRPTLPDSSGLARSLQAVIDSGTLTNGPAVRRLEAEAAVYLGVRHVVGVASCTSGLMLVAQACGMRGPVVLPSFTFSASAHALWWAGGRPCFADVEARTLTLDPDDVARVVEGASGVLGTHLYGSPCRVERLQEVADAAGVPLVYDAAHALGSRRRGRRIGGFGVAEVFSLSPTKVVIAGEGGLIATDDDEVAEACRLGRDYGNPGDYDCRFPGLNARMSELHATVALASLDGLDERVARRNALVRRFAAGLAEVPGVRVVVPDEGDLSTFKDLTCEIDAAAFGLTAEETAVALRAEGVDSRRYYAPPVHRQKAYTGLGGFRPLPVTDAAAERVLSPPLWSHMTDGQVGAVAEAIARVHRHAAAVRNALA